MNWEVVAEIVVALLLVNVLLSHMRISRLERAHREHTKRLRESCQHLITAGEFHSDAFKALKERVETLERHVPRFERD